MDKLDELLLSPNLNVCASVYKYMEVETNPPLSETENKIPANFSSNSFSWVWKNLVCWNCQDGSFEAFYVSQHMLLKIVLQKFSSALHCITAIYFSPYYFQKCWVIITVDHVLGYLFLSLIPVSYGIRGISVTSEKTMLSCLVSSG